MKKTWGIFISLLVCTFFAGSPAVTAADHEPQEVSIDAAETTLTYYGHSAFKIVTPKGQVLMIDPWLKNPLNPDAQDGKDPLKKVKRLDYILVTHAHFDHIGDSVALTNKTGARLVTNFELGGNMAHLLGFPKTHMRFDNLMNIGGEITIADGEVTVAMTQAIHSSGMQNPYSSHRQSLYVYGGQPAGFVLMIKGGPTIYHAGDTAYFSDMKLIGDNYAPDVALLPIGGHFTMEPAMAAQAAAAVKAKLAIPMHYKTFPVLEQTPARFIAALDKLNIPHLVMNPGETITFSGNTLKK